MRVFVFMMTMTALAAFMPFAPSAKAQYPQFDPSLSNPYGQTAQNGNVFDQRIDDVERRLNRIELTRLPSLEQSIEQRYAPETRNVSLMNDDAAIVDRLKDMEAKWKKYEDSEAKKKADAAKKPTQKWSGRIHWDYWGFPNESALANTYETGNPADNPNDRFTFRRVRFGVAGDILETMTYKVEMEFAVPNDPAFKDCYIGWKEIPVVQTLLLGNQKRPYGLDHLNSSRYNVFLERPFTVEAFNQDARRFGLCAYGVSENEAWNWRYGAFLMEDIQADGDYTSDIYQVELAGRLANTIWYDESSDGRGYAHWAVSGSYADPNPNPDGGASNQARFRTRPEARTVQRWYDTGAIAGAETYTLGGLEGVVNVGPLQVVAELQAVNVNRAAAVGPDLQFYGGYMYVAYFLTGEHTPWERDSGTLGRVQPFENFFLVERCKGGVGGGWGAWQVAARYSYGDFTDDNVFGGVGESFTAGLNWWWTPYSRMQFNYITGNITQGKGNAPNPSPPPTNITFAPGGSGHYDIFGARFMVDF